MPLQLAKCHGLFNWQTGKILIDCDWLIEKRTGINRHVFLQYAYNFLSLGPCESLLWSCYHKTLDNTLPNLNDARDYVYWFELTCAEGHVQDSPPCCGRTGSTLSAQIKANNFQAELEGLITWELAVWLRQWRRGGVWPCPSYLFFHLFSRKIETTCFA